MSESEIQFGTMSVEDRIRHCLFKASQARTAANQSAFMREDFLRVAQRWDALAGYFMERRLGSRPRSASEADCLKMGVARDHSLNKAEPDVGLESLSGSES